MLILCDTLNILYMYIVYTKNEGNMIKNNNFICLFIYCVLFFLNISLLYFHNSEMPFLRNLVRSNESVEKKIFVILVEIVLINTFKLVFTG